VTHVSHTYDPSDNIETSASIPVGTP
jgi:hypothetical protein